MLVLSSVGFTAAEKPLTRGELAKVINEAFGFTTASKTGFKDLKSNHPYYKDLLIAKSAGYFDGAASGNIGPDNTITKQELAVIIARIMKPQTTNASSELKKLKDKIPSWSSYAVASGIKYGYLKAEKDGKYQPLKLITMSAVKTVIPTALKNVVQSTYTKAGTYTTGKIYGTVRIDSKDVILKNAMVYGNLIIGEKVGSGNVTLKNVTVKGDTVVKGGGMNSIILDGSKFSRIIVTKVDNKVRIVAMGSTTVNQVEMQSGGKLEEQGVTGAAFGNVVIDQTVEASELISLVGSFESVEIQAEGISLNLAAGSVIKTMNIEAQVTLAGAGQVRAMNIQSPNANLNVTGSTSITTLSVKPNAIGASVSLAAGATVSNLVMDGAATVSGAGKITNAQINVAGSTVTASVGTTTGTQGATPPTSTGTTPGTTTPTTGGGSSGGGGGGSSSSTVTALTSADVTISSGSIVFDYDFFVSGTAVTYAQALAGPYYLNTTASAIRLSDGTTDSTAVTVGDIGIQSDGTVSYADLTAVYAKFGSLSFVPSMVKIHLVGASSVNSGANQWTLDVNVTIDSGEIALLTPSMAKVTTPTFTPNGGLVTTSTAITIATVTTGTAIYYTLDGSPVTTGSALYTSPINLNTTGSAITVKAAAFKTGMTPSDTATVVFNPVDFAEAITGYTVTSGSALGSTVVTYTPGGGNSLYVKVSGSNIDTPPVGYAIASVSGATAYTSGADIPGVTAGNYVGIYEVNGSNNIVKFVLVQLSLGDIK